MVKAKGTLSVQEAESPFALLETIFAGAPGESLASDAYRQVSYVNDINRANVQAVMEYTVNGGMGESTTAYSFGMQRESCTVALPGLAAGNAMEGISLSFGGTYYYTGTGSVSNLTDAEGRGRSYGYALSGEAHTFAMYQGETEAFSITAGTYSAYAYNGEYTHQRIGSMAGSKVTGGLSNLKTLLAPAATRKGTSVLLSAGYQRPITG